MTTPYKVRQELRPVKLAGISEDQIAQHWTLYEGYVKNVNLLNQKIQTLTSNEYYGAEFSELKRREGFEYNGMILHEHYFGGLRADQPSLKADSALAGRLQEDFGGQAGWKKQFTAMGKMRGVGWVILYHDRRLDRLSNFWVRSHEDGHPAGFTPVVVMDVWEHAYRAAAAAEPGPWTEGIGAERRVGTSNRRSNRRGESRT